MFGVETQPNSSCMCRCQLNVSLVNRLDSRCESRRSHYVRGPLATVCRSLRDEVRGSRFLETINPCLSLYAVAFRVEKVVEQDPKHIK